MSKPLAPGPGAAPSSASAVNASGTPSEHTTLVPKANRAAGDPAAMPHNRPVYAPKERTGASYGLQVGFEAHVDPAAGFTQANGRIFPHAINRSAPNFYSGIQDHN